MNDFAKIGARSARWKRYAWILAIVWTVVIVASLVWNVIQVRNNTLEAARIQARATYEKDVVYRRWNAGHGGVYVSVTKETQPNPYLSDVPERDITTPLGKALTLMNPAYMTRQAHELEKQKLGVRGHITSLNPIRPENAPDPWETEALRAFERRETEISSLQEMEGEEYMRLMRPLITESGCLKCHAVQGYEEGDIRGGISVAIPMSPLQAVAGMQVLTLAGGHILLWLMGIGGIVLGTQRLRQSEWERKRAEEDVKRYVEQLEQVNIRLQEMDRLKSVFLASMSHELRTPLNSIIGFTGIILQGMAGEVNEEQRKQLTMVKNSGSHLLSLINDLLDISKIEAGKVELSLEEFRLDDVVREVVEAFSPAVSKKGMELTMQVPEDMTLVSDKRRIKQVLMNLVSNAVKFTDQGSVQIVARVPEGETLETRVIDTGIGIKKEYMDKLFQPFQQIDVSLTKRHEGTGLGLYLTKKLVVLLGGNISAKSEYGRGSEFSFTIPLQYEEGN